MLNLPSLVLPHLADLDTSTRRSAVLLVWLIFYGMLALFGFALSQAISGLYALGLVSFTVACLLLGLLVWCRLGGSLERITHTFMTIAVIGQVAGALLTGGIFSFTLPSMALFPLFAFVVVGKRGGALWSAAVIVWFVLLYLLAVWDVSLPFEVVPQDLPGQRLGNLLVLMIYGVSIVSWQHGTTQLQQAEIRVASARAEAASAAKSRFLANISHELRTPMNAVIGLTELTLRRETLDPEDAETLTTSLRSATTMVRLLDDLLDMSRVEADMMTFEHVPTRPEQIVAEVFDLVAHRADQQRVTLHAHIAPDVHQGMGDPARLRQVVLNLVGNAVKFTQDGRIDVRIARQGDTVMFEVEDTGVGVEPEALPSLFEPFVQVDASTTRRFGGSGLGLAISRRLVQRMGGELTATSTPGVGSVFRFDIQLAPCETSPPRVSTSDDHPSDPVDLQPSATTGLTILVAEDNPVNRLVIRRQLDVLKAHVTLTNDGEEALAKMREQTFDLVLMDLHMPKLDGLASARQARQLGYTGEIVAMTASALPDDRAAALAAGMTGFLTKPATLDELKQLLEQRQPSA